jgi:hypothetical protein
MSVTFGCPDTEPKLVPCRFCIDARREGHVRPDETCIPGCDGLEPEYPEPQCNFANSNARDILAALGLADEELCGRVDHGDLPEFIRKIIRVINSRGIDSMAREPEEFSGAQGCKVIVCGSTPERARERFNSILVLAKWAQENGHGISWG